VNMGMTDRIIRAILGVVAFLVAFLWVGGALQFVLWVIGGDFARDRINRPLPGIFAIPPVHKI
jgi:hypothetical protein